jgi:hypothetical protein
LRTAGVQVGEFIEERFGSACNVLLLDVYGTSVDEQLTVTTAASVFVSQTGTLTDSLAIFLKPGAVLIEIGQYVGGNVVMHNNNYIYPSIPYLQARVRPQCARRKG